MGHDWYGLLSGRTSKISKMWWGGCEAEEAGEGQGVDKGWDGSG